MNPILASSLPVRKFMDPDNYATPFQGWCMCTVAMWKVFTCCILWSCIKMYYSACAPVMFLAYT